MKILDTPRSGSVAGVTASRNRFGQYYRTRAVPVQPRTPKQTANRSLFTSGSSSWRGLSDTDRTAWNDYAAQISRSGSLGSSYSPSGAMLFTGASVIAATPALLTTPPATLPDYVLNVTGMGYTDPTPGPEAFNFTIATTSANNSVVVETSGPVSPGITSAAAVRRWRSLPPNAANLNPEQFPMNATPVDILAAYKRLFPSPASGQVIWFRFNELFIDPASFAGIANSLKQTFRFVVP